MVAIVIFWPGLVTAFLDKPSTVDPSKIEILIPSSEEQKDSAPPDFGSADRPGDGEGQKSGREDPARKMGSE